MSKVFCAAPFIHMYMAAGEEAERVCCQAKPYKRTTNTWDLEDRWHGQSVKDIRQQMLDSVDEPTNYIKNMCSRCLNQEDAGDESDRIRFNRHFNDLELNVETGNEYDTPLDLDLRPGNLCNLQCRMCYSGSSSQIEKEIQKSKGSLLRFMGSRNVEVADWATPENMKFLLKNISENRRLKFLGGEPTIMPEVHDILDILLDNDITDVPIQFTTNLTNVNRKFLKKLERFTNISFNYSIDGTGKTVEYIRYPVNWDAIKQNILEYEKIASYSAISYTLQAYNLHNLKEFLSWADDVGVKVNINMVSQPDWDSVFVLPQYYREKYLTGINLNSTNHILQNDKEGSIIGFIRNTKILDESRKQHIKDYIPEIWEIIQEDYDAIQI